MNEDGELLRRYAETKSEAAFTDLVGRHIDLVYSVARRLLRGDTHLAEDVVQTVFFDLSRKAKRIPDGTPLEGWLCRHTFFVASAKVRTEQRRRARERVATQMRESNETAGPDWDQVSQVLDEVLQGLGAADRHALVLRYLKGRNLRTVGLALGVSEDAAQKRVSRALERLRLDLGKRGIGLGLTALASLLTEQAVAAAPAGLAAKVSASVLAGSVAGSGSLVTWIQFMAWCKTKTTVISSALVLAAALTTSTLLVWPPAAPPPEARAAASGPSGGAKDPALELAGPPAAKPTVPFHWSQLESTDYHQYVANLRAIGCPEQVVRDLVVADLNQAFLARRLAIWKPPTQAYWRPYVASNPSPEQRQALQALDREKDRFLKELLGAAIDGPSEFSLVFLQRDETRSGMVFLPPEKRRAALEALQEAGLYDQDRSLTRAESLAAFDQKLACLATVLAPEDLDEYRLRNSPLMQWLRGTMRYMNCSREEFKALLECFEPRWRNQLPLDEAVKTELIRQALGEARVQEYARFTDHGYNNGRAGAEGAGLEGDLADWAGQLVYEARRDTERLARDTQLTRQERLEQIARVQAQAEARLERRLDGQARAAVRSQLRATLGNTVEVYLR